MGTGHLILDVGNTRSKAALFRGGVLRRWAVLPAGDAAAVAGFLDGEAPAAIGIGSVAADRPALMARLAAIAPVHVLTGASPAPFATRVRDRAALGVDRLANAVGAALRFPGRAVLVIDPGTAITYDLVGPDGTHAGGAISPGAMMRVRALHAYSARLPLIDPDKAAAEWTGTGTEGALRAGVHFGIVGEMEGFVRTARRQWPDLAVVLTGGDALRYMSALKSGIFAVPLLTLEGLHALLLHQLPVPPAADAPAPGHGGGPGPAG